MEQAEEPQGGIKVRLYFTFTLLNLFLFFIEIPAAAEVPMGAHSVDKRRSRFYFKSRPLKSQSSKKKIIIKDCLFLAQNWHILLFILRLNSF